MKQWSLVECEGGKCRYKCAFCPVVTAPTPHSSDRIKCDCLPPTLGAKIDHVAVMWLGVGFEQLVYAAVAIRFAKVLAASHAGWFRCDKPGACLADMLRWIVPAYVSSGGCGSCPKRMEEMDANGVEWCAANVETIAGWLKENSEKMRLPFNEWAATVLVRRAVTLSGKR
jgi:hypothetical protein